MFFLIILMIVSLFPLNILNVDKIVKYDCLLQNERIVIEHFDARCKSEELFSIACYFLYIYL